MSVKISARLWAALLVVLMRSSSSSSPPSPPVAEATEGGAGADLPAAASPPGVLPAAGCAACAKPFMHSR